MLSSLSRYFQQKEIKTLRYSIRDISSFHFLCFDSLLHEAYNQAYPTIPPNNPIEQVKLISFTKKNSLEDESNDMEDNGTRFGFYEVDVRRYEFKCNQA